MELLQLRYFQAVARHEHLTRAAEELHIAQPALSKTIARLEHDLGAKLFDRGKRRIQLNENGRLFLKQVEIALSALAEGERQLQDRVGLAQQQVVLASTNFQCDAEIVSSFLSSYPEKNLMIKQTDNEHQSIELVKKGETDFYVTSRPFEHPEMEKLGFITEQILLVVSRKHRFAKRKKIQLHEVATEPFITLPSGNQFRELTMGFCEEAGFKPTIACVVDRLTAIGSFVQSGIGVSFLTHDTKQVTDDIVLIPIEKPICTRTFQLVWHKSRYLTKSAQAFRQFVQHQYANKSAKSSY